MRDFAEASRAGEAGVAALSWPLARPKVPRPKLVVARKFLREVFMYEQCANEGMGATRLRVRLSCGKERRFPNRRCETASCFSPAELKFGASLEWNGLFLLARGSGSGSGSFFSVTSFRPLA